MSRMTLGQTGEHGFRITVRTRFDASSGGPKGEYDAATMRVSSPAGVTTDYGASTDDASSGDFYWVPPAGVLVIPGVWKFQLILTWGVDAAEGDFRSGVMERILNRSLEDPA